MSIDCHKKNIELQTRVKKELDNIKGGISTKNSVQLEMILNELQLAEKKVGINLSYPRIIIDSWDFSDKLGLDLVSYAEKYRNTVEKR